jgi:hypothetical protein
MDVLLHIATADAAAIAAALGRALNAEGAAWGCFLTSDGVKAVGDTNFAAASEGASRVVVCEHSWDQHMDGQDCPVERGSQTINSALMAEAERVVSL